MNEIIAKKILSRLHNGIRKIYPQFGYQESDIHIASYAKSGRNWVHFLLAHAFEFYSSQNRPINFHTISDWISEDFPKKPPASDIPLPRIVARHRLYEGQDVRVMYIMRHPADVMTSYYYYLIGRKNERLDSFASLIRDESLGIPAWVEHVESWQDHLNMLIRYEDLKENALHELSRMIRFIGLSSYFSEDMLQEVVEKSSFESMSRIEKKWGLPEKPGKNSNFTFMREGKSTQGKEMFSDSDYSYLESKAGHILEQYGYDLKIDGPTAQ